MNPAELKRQARGEMRALLGRMDPGAWRAASEGLRAVVVAQEFWRRARAVLLFSPVGGELDVRPLAAEALAAGRLVALPRFDPASGEYLPARLDGLESLRVAGPFGVLEPPAEGPVVEWGLLDAALVPGLAFDYSGTRLGRGKGYYDKMLRHMACATCGVCLEGQLVERLPAEPHDVPVRGVATPGRWMEARPS